MDVLRPDGWSGNPPLTSVKAAGQAYARLSCHIRSPWGEICAGPISPWGMIGRSLVDILSCRVMVVCLSLDVLRGADVVDVVLRGADVVDVVLRGADVVDAFDAAATAAAAAEAHPFFTSPAFFLFLAVVVLLLVVMLFVLSFLLPASHS